MVGFVTKAACSMPKGKHLAILSSQLRSTRKDRHFGLQYLPGLNQAEELPSPRLVLVTLVPKDPEV